jgi:hypothetical protein
MENIPSPDFVIAFYNNLRIIYSGSTKLFQVKIPSNLISQYPLRKAQSRSDGSVSSTINFEKGDAEPALEEVLKHFKECIRQCMEISESGAKDPFTKYPMILKANQSPSKAFTSGKFSPPLSTNTVNTFSTSIQRTESKSVASEQISLRPPLITSTSKSRTYLNSARDSRLSHQSEALSTCSISNFTPNFIPDIGWCVQTPDKRFAMLFQDGIQLIVNPKTHSLEYFYNGDQS